MKFGDRVRVLVGPSAGRLGVIYDLGPAGETVSEVKIQLGGDSAGDWWPCADLQVVPCGGGTVLRER